MLFVLGNDELQVNGEFVDRLLENAVVDVLLLIDPLFSKMLFMLVLASELFEVIDRLLDDVRVPVGWFSVCANKKRNDQRLVISFH